MSTDSGTIIQRMRKSTPLPKKKSIRGFRISDYRKLFSSLAPPKAFLGCPEVVSELSDPGMILNNNISMFQFSKSKVAFTFYEFRNEGITSCYTGRTGRKRRRRRARRSLKSKTQTKRNYQIFRYSDILNPQISLCSLHSQRLDDGSTI